MIRLTQNDNQKFVINCEHIETINSIPETKITTFNNHIYIVKESIDQVIEKVLEYKNLCFVDKTVNTVK